MLRIAFVTQACACQSEVQETRIVDSAGISISVARDVEKVLPWEMTLLRALNGANGPIDKVMVERSTQVVADGRERVYVLDDVDNAVLAFAPDGRLIWKRGRSGGGPGEWVRPSFLRVEPSGTIQVTDQGKRALVRFDRDGALQDEISLASHAYPQSPIYLNGDTVVIEQYADSGWSLRLKVRSAVTELAQARITSLGTATFRCGTSTVTMNGALRLLGPGIVWDVSDGKVVAAVESEYSIRIFEAGNLVAIVRRAVKPRRTRTTDIEQLYPDGTWMGRRDCKLSADVLVSQFGVEPFLPMVRGVLVAPNGALWVERFTMPDESTLVDVFDSQLAFLGTVVGMGRPVGFLSKGRFVALVADEKSGLHEIRLYQIIPTPW